jgi:hypothetical protein
VLAPTVFTDACFETLRADNFSTTPLLLVLRVLLSLRASTAPAVMRSTYEAIGKPLFAFALGDTPEEQEQEVAKTLAKPAFEVCSWPALRVLAGGQDETKPLQSNEG